MMSKNDGGTWTNQRYNDVVFLWKTKNDGRKKNDGRRMMACLYKNDGGTKHNLKKSDIEECGRYKNRMMAVKK